MSRNLNRLTAAANRESAQRDFMFVWAQVKAHNPPEDIYSRIFANGWDNTSAKTIDRATRSLIEWSGAKGIEITLPDGWT